MAVGRTANTKLLNLDKINIKYNKNNLKIISENAE
jgi:pyruvate/2-oxoglutarate dehydrogenase complex dihydrolipoamide dehydrogenase (E3) component